jgi:hypothetical protein
MISVRMMQYITTKVNKRIIYNVACGGQAQHMAFVPTALFEESANARSVWIHIHTIAVHTDRAFTYHTNN